MRVAAAFNLALTSVTGAVKILYALPSVLTEMQVAVVGVIRKAMQDAPQPAEQSAAASDQQQQISVQDIVQPRVDLNTPTTAEPMEEVDVPMRRPASADAWRQGHPFLFPLRLTANGCTDPGANTAHTTPQDLMSVSSTFMTVVKVHLEDHDSVSDLTAFSVQCTTDQECLHNIVRALYIGKLVLSATAVREVLRIADFLGIQMIRDVCEQYMRNSMLMEHPKQVFDLANEVNLQGLAIDAHVLLMKRPRHLQHLPIDELRELLHSENSSHASELQVIACLYNMPVKHVGLVPAVILENLGTLETEILTKQMIWHPCPPERSDLELALAAKVFRRLLKIDQKRNVDVVMFNHLQGVVWLELDISCWPLQPSTRNDVTYSSWLVFGQRRFRFCVASLQAANPGLWLEADERTQADTGKARYAFVVLPVRSSNSIWDSTVTDQLPEIMSGPLKGIENPGGRDEFRPLARFTYPSKSSTGANQKRCMAIGMDVAL